MTANLTSYIENADSVSLGDAAFQLQNGKASSLYYLLASDAQGDVNTADVYAAITQILGSVSTAVGDGRLQRSLPLAHPLFGWLFASGVSIKGMGQGYKFPGLTGMETTPFPNGTAYPNYQFHVEFTPRPFVVAPDTSITKYTSIFVDETGTPVTAQIASEWMRYTDWWYERKFESITARQGSMRFRTANGAAPGGTPYSDMPRLFLPDSIVKFMWYQVPYRYLTSANSYLDYFAGYVNQTKFMTWKPGELLYLGCKPIRYTPPVQGLEQLNTGASGFIFSTEKLVDVELTFLRTSRRLASAAEKFAELSNGNWVQAGHNLMPWLGDRKFHYVTAVGPANTDDSDQSKWAPLFPSTEFGLFFTDPDMKGGYPLPT